MMTGMPMRSYPRKRGQRLMEGAQRGDEGHAVRDVRRQRYTPKSFSQVPGPVPAVSAPT